MPYTNHLWWWVLQGVICLTMPADGPGGGCAAPPRKRSSASAQLMPHKQQQFFLVHVMGPILRFWGDIYVLVPADGAAGGSAAAPRKRSKASVQTVPNEQLQQQQQSQQEAYDQARLAQVSMRQTGIHAAPVTCAHIMAQISVYPKMHTACQACCRQPEPPCMLLPVPNLTIVCWCSCLTWLH